MFKFPVYKVLEDWIIALPSKNNNSLCLEDPNSRSKDIPKLNFSHAKKDVPTLNDIIPPERLIECTRLSVSPKAINVLSLDWLIEIR